MASQPFTINRRPKDDDDTDVMEEELLNAEMDSAPYDNEYTELPWLRSKEQFLEFPSKVIAFLTEAEAELKQTGHLQGNHGIDTLILDLILSYSSYLLSPPLDLLLVGGCFGVSRSLSYDYADEALVMVLDEYPKAHRVNVRANISAPSKPGKYYFELDINEGFTHAVGGVGWCDEQWTGHVDEDKVDRSLLPVDGYVPFGVIGEDAHSWAIDGNGEKFHNAMSCVPPDSAEWLYADENGARGYSGVPYCRKWKARYCVGCGIERTETQTSMTFFLDGKPIGVAWINSTTKSIYPACTLITGDDHALYSEINGIEDQINEYTMFFQKDDLMFLPEGYEPLYEIL